MKSYNQCCFLSTLAPHIFLTVTTLCLLCMNVTETEADIHECVKMGYIDKDILGPLVLIGIF